MRMSLDPRDALEDANLYVIPGEDRRGRRVYRVIIVTEFTAAHVAYVEGVDRDAAGSIPREQWDRLIESGAAWPATRPRPHFFFPASLPR